MSRQSHRIRIDDRGLLEIVDPGFDSMELLQAINPDFKVKQSLLPGFDFPRFQQLRMIKTDVSPEHLKDLSEIDLWKIHDQAISEITDTKYLETGDKAEESFVSILEVKIALVREVLKQCRLCARKCGVDRTEGEEGFCGLGETVYVAEHFVHIAEESPINPSLVLNLQGCALRCKFCQQYKILEPERITNDELAETLWPKLDFTKARSISFIGGNPDESLYAILRFLNFAPQDWNLPVVWNCHGYSTPETMKLLRGVVDAYIPDLKYMSDSCGLNLSGVSNYQSAVIQTITAMLSQNVPVFVRILVLPGHFDCCHKPAIDFLSTFLPNQNLSVSVRGQYCPDWKITETDGNLARRTSIEEYHRVTDYAVQCGLSLVN